MILKRIAISCTVALIAAACGAGADDLADKANPTQSTEATTATSAVVETEPVGSDDHQHADDAANDHDDEEAAHDEQEDGALHNDEETAGHEEDAGADSDVARIVEIRMGEFSYEPSTVSVNANETVEFVVINTGAIEHEFRLTTQHAALEHIEAGHEGHHDDAAVTSGHEHGEIILVVDAGATDAVTVTFDEHSDYDIVACLLPDHYEAGMHAALSLES